MVRDARRGREATLAKGTGDAVSAVRVAIQVLGQINAQPGIAWMHTDRIEIVLAFKASLAIAAPVLAPVAILMHVSFGCRERVKIVVAALALEFRAPMAVLIHVLAGVILCPEHVVARFALPVAYSVHMLFCGMPVTK
jgi:hypothetical protein